MEYTEKNINIEELSKRTGELEKLLNESDASLENIKAIFHSYFQSIMHVYDDPYEHALPDDASLGQAVMYGIKRDVSPFSRFVISTGEATFIAAKTTWKLHKMLNPSKKKQKELLACYKELTAKNNLLIQAQQEIISELNRLQNQTGSEVQSLKMQLEEINGILQRVSVLRNHVETVD